MLIQQSSICFNVFLIAVYMWTARSTQPSNGWTKKIIDFIIKCIA